MHSKRPLLIPWARQTKRLIPRGQLDGARAGFFRKHDRQHFKKDSINVVFGLLLGKAERVHLHSIAEAPELRVSHPVALLANFVPQINESAHLAHLGDEADPCVHEKGYPADRLAKFGFRYFAARLHRIEHGFSYRQSVSEFLDWRRTRFLKMIGANIGGIPLWDIAQTENNDVLDKPHRRLRGKHISAARQVFFDNVVLNGAG